MHSANGFAVVALLLMLTGVGVAHAQGVSGVTTEIHDIGAVDGISGAYAHVAVIRQYRFGTSPQSARVALRIRVAEPPAVGPRSAVGHIERPDVPLTHRAASEVLTFFQTLEGRREPAAEVEFKAGSITFGINLHGARQLLYVAAPSLVVLFEPAQWQKLIQLLADAEAAIRKLPTR